MLGATVGGVARLRAAGSAPAAVCSLPHVGARRRRPLRVRDSSAQPLVAEPANGTTNGASGDAAAAPLGQAAAIPSPAAPAPAEPQAVRVVNAVLPMQGILLPPDVYQQVAAIGEMKANLPTWQNFVLAVAAGCYTAMFASLMLSVGPNCGGLVESNWGLARYITGAIGLPFQLCIILVCGGELFTGSTAQLATAFYEGRATAGQVLRQWGSSYLGNVVGCLLGVALLLNTGLVPNFRPGLEATALAKISIPLKEVVVRGVLANWLVCLAVWQATAAQSVGGRLVGIIGPVSAFITLGFEHCIANWVFLPMAIATGVSGVTWKTALCNNLIPVTLANVFAGVVCVSAVYSLAFGALGKRVNAQFGRA